MGKACDAVVLYVYRPEREPVVSWCLMFGSTLL